uniref:Ground-like domain-containing protein n=1 Tax=Parascaris univalens TaxID=6257 RepID=A0A915B7C0_PARUN
MLLHFSYYNLNELKMRKKFTSLFFLLQTPPLFTQNICCVTCIIPCMMRARKRRDVSAQNFTAALNTIVDDATCNNLKLKSVMDENMSEKDPKMAMMKVRKAIEKKLPGKYSVICANGDFSYTAYTDSFCQTRNDPLTCYAFKPLMLEASLVSRA